MIITIDTKKAKLTANQIKQIHEIIIGSPLTQSECKCEKPARYPTNVTGLKNICHKCFLPIKPPQKIEPLPLRAVDKIGWTDLVDNRTKINEIISHINKGKI